MSRKFSLLFLVAAITTMSACANLTGPAHEDGPPPPPPECIDGVVAGTQTAC